MDNLKTFKISSLGIDLIRKGDLIYHEGPFLSHFVGSDGHDYLYKWSDCDENHNRWLIFSVSHEKLASFFQKKISLLDLIRSNSFVYFLDLDEHLNEASAYVCPVARIPSDYLPSEQSFFEEEQYEAYADILRNSLEPKSEYTPKNDLLEILLQEVTAIKKSQEQQRILLKQIQHNMPPLKPTTRRR